LCDSCVVEGEDDAIHEVCVSSALAGEPDSPVPAEKEERRAHDVPWDFYQHLADSESCPVVHPAWALADFVDRPNIDVHSLELLREGDTKH